MIWLDRSSSEVSLSGFSPFICVQVVLVGTPEASA